MDYKLNIDQRCAVLVDGNNIERGIKEAFKDKRLMLDFDELVPRILNDRKLGNFVYFREGQNISQKFSDRLIAKFFGVAVPCHKSADIPLTIKACQLASKVDTIIIFSGDSDYIELVKYLRNEGVRVEIVSVSHCASKELISLVDNHYYITRDDCYYLEKGVKRQ